MARTLDLGALRSFVAICEHGGVTRAATRLNLTQSAVSMQLKRLETSLGQPLFDRERKAMVPTVQGEMLLSYARRMLDLNDEVWARMTEQQYEGELTLGAPHDIVYPHIPEVLRRFTREYPRVRITLHSSYTHELKEQFARGDIDVILTTETAPDPQAEILQESELVWIGAPAGVVTRPAGISDAFSGDGIMPARPGLPRAASSRPAAVSPSPGLPADRPRSVSLIPPATAPGMPLLVSMISGAVPNGTSVEICAYPSAFPFTAS